MFTRLYQQVPLLNRLPPWAVALGAAFTLILAGMGQGLVQGQTTTAVEQTVTVATALSATFRLGLPTVTDTTLGSTTLAANTVAGDPVISVSSAANFSSGDIVRIGTDAAKQEFRVVAGVDTTLGANKLRLDAPLGLAHTSTLEVKEVVLLEDTILGGVVTDQKTRFLVQLTLRQGEKGRIKLALENNSNLPAVARIEISGLPAGAGLNATTVSASSLDFTKVNEPVRFNPTTFFVAIQPQTKGSAVNLAIDLQSADTTQPGTYPLDIRLQQVPN